MPLAFCPLISPFRALFLSGFAVKQPTGNLELPLSGFHHACSMIVWFCSTCKHMETHISTCMRKNPTIILLCKQGCSARSCGSESELKIRKTIYQTFPGISNRNKWQNRQASNTDKRTHPHTHTKQILEMHYRT